MINIDYVLDVLNSIELELKCRKEESKQEFIDRMDDYELFCSQLEDAASEQINNICDQYDPDNRILRCVDGKWVNASAC